MQSESSINEHIKHVVVCELDAHKKHEIEDSYLVYASAEKRKGKTLLATSQELPQVLESLKELKVAGINLVFLGHLKDKKIGSVDIEFILSMLSNFEIISKVTLLSCFSARSSMTNTEKKMIKDFNAKNEWHQHGFILVSQNHELNATVFNKMLASTKLNAIYILSSTGDFFNVKKNENNNLQVENVKLDSSQLEELRKALKLRKEFNFPKESFTMLRTSNNSLKSADQMYINVICRWPNLFDRQNKNYKSRKEYYPFLTYVTIKEDELNKVQSSFFKSLVQAIMSNPDIKQEITVKGFLNAVHVDTEKKCFFIMGSYLPSYKHSFFSTAERNIDIKELIVDQGRKVDEMMNIEELEKIAKESEISLDSIAKGMAIIIPKKKP